MELNREQIVKALECQVGTDENHDCRGCYFYKEGRLCSENMSEGIATAALALIRELTEERDKLDLTLAGVMHFVDKWLDCDELKQADEVARAITMREKTLRITEQLTEEIERLNREATKLQIFSVFPKEEELKYLNALERMSNDYKTIRADTVRKMQERLRSLLKTDYINGTREHALSVIDRIAKEIMEGGEDHAAD